MINVTPVTLESNGIRLEPMTAAHQGDLTAAVADGRLWELWYVATPHPDSIAKYVADALKGQSDGLMLPWAVRDVTSGRIIGATRYHDIVANIDRVEIGYTWYSQRFQRTHVTT